MCGIYGYIGKDIACNEVFEGLKKLEYRGYDSCGISCITKNKLQTSKHLGAPSDLKFIKTYKSDVGIGHTRWATHGAVTLKNAHPHLSNSKKISVVHNGIIENYSELKDTHLQGFKFKSDTDSEVLANLIELHLQSSNSLIVAVKESLRLVTGTYGIAVIHLDEPNIMVGAKRSSPLVAGLGTSRGYLTSDTHALPDEITKVIYLEDDQLIELRDKDFTVYSLTNDNITPKHKTVKIRKTKVELGDYSCYMEKEIQEQPISIRNCLRGRLANRNTAIKFGGLFGGLDNLKSAKRVLFVACGTAFHAALIGKYYLEEIAGIPATVEIASEYNCKNLPIERGTLAIAISQSGETLDTINAVKDLKDRKIKTIAITNAVGSTLARTVDAGIYQYAGPEVSVASTKAFTSQSTLLLMLSLFIGKHTKAELKRYIQRLRSLPELISKCMAECHGTIRKLAYSYQMTKSVNFLGRQALYPIALEGSLKLKELAYIHSHGYPAGELKHGPLATISRGFVTLYLAGQVDLQEKNISSMKEIKSRGGSIILIKQKSQEFPEDVYDYVIDIPDCPEELLPIVSVIPLQLFAMNSAQARKLNVDKPRNLAKSVTVE